MAGRKRGNSNFLRTFRRYFGIESQKISDLNLEQLENIIKRGLHN